MPPPRWISLLVTLLSGLTALWALVGAILSVTLAPTPIWTLLGFETVIAVSGVLGVFLGLGKYREAPALALICVAGAILVGSFLGYRGSAGAIGTLSLKPWIMGRLAVGLTLALLAALTVLVRSRKSWPALFAGLAFAAIPAGLACVFGLAALGYGRPLQPAAATPSASPAPTAARQPVALDNAVRQVMSLGLFQPAKGGKEAARMVMLAILGILMICLTSAGTHYLIKAFQLGALPDVAAAPPSPPAAAQAAI